MNYLNKKIVSFILFLLFVISGIFFVYAENTKSTSISKISNKEEQIKNILKEKIKSLNFFKEVVKFDKNTQTKVYNIILDKINLLLKRYRNNSSNIFVLKVLKEVIIEKVQELNPITINPPETTNPPITINPPVDYGDIKDIINVDPLYEESHPLPPDFFGFNEGLYGGNFNFKDEQYLEQLREIKPKSERFPGGTQSNFLHWETGTINEDEIATLSNSPMRNTALKNNKMLLESEGNLRFDEFIEASNSVGSNVYLVLNLFYGTPEESARWAQYTKDKGYKIAGWELGNELYMWGAYNQKIPNVQEYIRIAKEHVNAIKAVLPDARFGIVAAPYRTTTSNKKYDLEWNNAIAAEDFYDAYILHNYFGFPENKEMTTQELADYIFAISNSNITKRMEYYRDLFNNRPIWMTEWNYSGFKYMNANNTHTNALYVSDAFINLLKYPELEVAMYHTFAPAGRWPGLFFDAKFIKEHVKGNSDIVLPDSCTNTKRCVLRTNIFYPFWIISRAITNSKYVIPLKISKNDMRKFTFDYDSNSYDLEYPLLKVIGLGDTEKVNKLLVTNLKERQVVLNLSNVTNNSSEVKLECITNSTLDSKENNSLTPEDNIISKYVYNYTFNADKVIFPKYSFCSASF